MQIRLAVPADLDAIMRVVDTARQFMRENGNKNQWINGYPSRALYAADMEAGHCYVVTEENQVHAVFTMLPGPDPTYAVIEDGAWPSDVPYAVIHRIGSDGQLRGVLRAAVDYTGAVCPVIRADTHRDNLPMQNALKKCGFVRCGVIYCDDGTPREAFQKN